MRSSDFRPLETCVAFLYVLGAVSCSFYLMYKLMAACLSAPAFLDAGGILF